MKTALALAGSAVAVLATVSACGGPVEDIDALRDAYVEAGGGCDDFELSDDTNRPSRWTATATCDGSTLLFLYSDAESRDADIASFKSVAEDRESKLSNTHGITGEYWIITPSEDYDIAKTMDGKIVSFP
ncbi:hypothetical protein LY15_002604 [Prauserella flava]|nr:hypothetical protein [Prauserella flava]MCR3735302.1 hypothetical protein [Prauserella salsuginis]